MIESLEIKKFGIFNEYDSSDIKFDKYNLIFGWNYTGKTTLSRIFSCFDEKALPDDYEDIKFKLKCTGQECTQEQLDRLNIKVFNSDYVSKNLKFEDSGAENIIVLTKGADEIVNKIKNLEIQSANLGKQIKEHQDNYSEYKKIFDKSYTDTARIISEKLNLGRRFDAASLRKIADEIKELKLEDFVIDEESLVEEIKTCNTSEEKVDVKILPNILLPNLKEINIALKKIISISEPLGRLKDKPCEEEWVRNGLDFHRELTECLYCGQNITDDIIKSLEAHFSETYRLFGEEIAHLQNGCKKVDLATFPKTSEFYPKFAKNYEELRDKLDAKLFNEKIQEIIEILDKKSKDRITEFPEIEQYDFQSAEAIITGINDLIVKNNALNIDFTREQEETRNKVKKHYASILLLDKNFKLAEKEILNSDRATGILTRYQIKKTQKIDGLRRQISEAAAGAEKVTQILKCLFLNNTSIKLEAKKDSSGNYVTRLYRGERIATNLSEGEKTAIAFAHYLACLEDKENVNQKSNIVLFIDDPISSLDSNHIYSVHAYIEKLKKDNYRQIFISTHNYELYKLFIDHNDKYMPKCFYIKKIANGAKLIQMPEKLKKLRSEYNFLFYNLKKFLEDTSDSLESIHIGNSLRKFLEMFTAIKRPSPESLIGRTKKIAEISSIDEVHISSILKLADSSSHSQIEKYLMDENLVKNTIMEVFEFVKKADRNHYECLEENYNAVCSSS